MGRLIDPRFNAQDIEMNANSEQLQTESGGQHQVVALKYRPQSFEKLVGQNHIATALRNAIERNRVGHAYLFTGARGVGKTSSARIFAKCLNCEHGPTATPCDKANQCDACEKISTGEDVDVIEIDGASNRGIDEIRQLRSNAAVRPSRSKYKIYIIDEVHMLTMQAFNALLKTLEEPPAHVKFIFCTTDPQKIPITVLSRCQRFDFSPVQTDEIANRLREIAENEGMTADDQALALLARRANGSMRDSQSLLEQLCSFCAEHISVDDVNQLLGTADMSRIADIATAMSKCDPTETLTLIHQGIIEGVDAGQVANQLLGYFRDMMTVKVGCGVDTLLNCTQADLEQLQALADDLGLETILTIVQLLDGAVVRMQASLHARTLLEAAAVRICNLEKLESLSDLVESLSKAGSGERVARSTPGRSRPRVPMRQVNVADTQAANDTSKKNGESNLSERSAPETQPSASPTGATLVETSDDRTVDRNEIAPPRDAGSSVKEPAEEFSPAAEANDKQHPVNSSPTEPDEDVAKQPSSAQIQPATVAGGSFSESEIRSVWDKLLEKLGDMTADMAADYERLELKQPRHLLVTLPDTVSKDLCSKPERKQKFESVMHELTGSKFRVDFATSEKARQEHVPVPKLTRVQQIRKLQQEEFVKQTMSLFDAEITGYREPAPRKSAAR
jgi:DNA polymerase-3 subunit gamma/tau